MIEKYEAIVPIDVSSDIPAYTIVGWGCNEEKYVVATQTTQDTFSGDSSTKTFNLSHGDLLADSVTVTVDGTEQTEGTDYTVDYENGSITFDSAPNNGTTITVEYSYFAADPSGILMEDVVSGQSPAYAKVLFQGIVYEDDFPTPPTEHEKARLRKVNIYVEKKV